jgi:carbon-monoxide dehydrogenase medium subunit
VIPAPFEYVRPSTLDELFEALADPEARVIAGGHSLLPMMKLRLAQPKTLVDIAGLDFGGVAEADGSLRIGALTTYAELLELDPRIGLPDVLRECAASVGDLQVRNAGTIGGSLAHGDPASDLAAGVLAVGARLSLRSPGGERELPSGDFFLGLYTTALAAQEVLTAIVVPRRSAGAGSAYVSFDDPASGYPLAGAAVHVAAADGAPSIGLCGVGERPLHASSAADALAKLSAADEYPAHLATVAIELAVALARKRAERSAP